MRLPPESVAVVTGAGSGLGRAISLELARRGGRIVVSDVVIEHAEDTAALIRATGGEAWAVACDVGDWRQVEALADSARQLAGEVDLIVNNAGVAAGGHVGEVSLDDWHWVMRVNLWGVIHGCRAFVPAMRARGRGWILNVASAAGFACLAQFAPYNVTKAGVIALSETLRAELEPLGIGVTVLCPSFFQTNILDGARGDDDDTRELVRRLMRGSSLQADDVARSAIEGLERGRLHIMPMPEARAAWIAKRALPGSFHRIANWARRGFRLQRSGA